MGAVNKVKFLDEHREHYMLENSALRSKLQSKVDALQIIAKELDKCRSERDHFKIIAEELQERYTLLKKKSYEGINYYDEPIDYSKVPGLNVAQLLNDTRERNKALYLEIENMRQKLSEAEGDIKVLRKQQSNHRFNDHTAHTFSMHQREELVEQLEKANLKISQLQTDLQVMLDDKEELIKERDAFKCKVHRLNHELSALLKAENNPLLDGDALISENRYLHERLQQSQEEIEHLSQAATKYKSMLETKRQKGAIKLGSKNSDMIMSHKQVKHLLEDGTAAEFPPTPNTIADLKSLCLGLLESLNDKSLALTHQRKANKILASRVQELEQRIENGKSPCVFPSQILLENYCSSDVDRQDVSQVIAELKPIKQEKETVDEIRTQENNECNNSTDQEEMKLPPQLQKLVDKARQELDSANEGS